MGAVLQSAVSATSGESERQLVERVVASDLFQKSPRLRELLLYVADCTLERRLTDVREQVIAERVFGRKSELGGQDSIVRAEARNLRKRLDLYFQTEGRHELMTIEMPKGGYALAFPLRASTVPAVLQEDPAVGPLLVPAVQPQAHELVGPASASSSRFYQFLCLGLALIAFAASSVAVYFFTHQQQLLKRLNVQAPALPFSALFQDDNEALIVTSDVGLLQIASLLHRRISLDEYIARSYPAVTQTNPPNLIQNWNVYEFTDGRETAIAGLILRHNAQFAPHIFIHSGHAVQLQDFKEHNVVLIGSPISNPWAQLYEEKLNFRCDLETDGRIVFRNLAARAGQQSEFPSDDDNQHHRTYARVVFLPKTSDAGATLLIAGTTAQSTQAAGEFVIDGATLSQVLRKAGINAEGPPHFFEILIRSSNFVGGAISTEVVAVRSKSAAK